MVRKITALKLQKRNHQRINVYLDGEFAFGVSRIVAAWLELGQEISDEKIAQLKAEDNQEVAYQRALKFIDYRERSEAEVRDKLSKSDYSDEVIERVIQHLGRIEILNDQRFAEEWVENRVEFRPRSRRALSFELRQKGISEDVIDETLANTPEDEQLAYMAASKQSRKYKNLEWPDFRRKLSGYLARRGFSYYIIAPVMDRVWAELRSDQDTG